MTGLASIGLAILEYADHGPYVGTSLPFKARYDGRCPACGRQIKADDSVVVYARHFKAEEMKLVREYFIHERCDAAKWMSDNRRTPYWPGLKEELHEWLSQESSPHIIIAWYDGMENTCASCKCRFSHMQYEVRRYGEFPFIKRLCENCV